MKILVVNGVNINMTGLRESIYGDKNLDEINAAIKEYVGDKAQVEFFQSNIEGEIVDRIQRGDFDGLIINAGAYSHYSYAIADALAYCGAAKVEVHLTNILARESFRRTSVTAEKCNGVICGFGYKSYLLAAEYLLCQN